jgi:hypothetical protein
MARPHSADEDEDTVMAHVHGEMAWHAGSQGKLLQYKDI